MIFRKVSNGSSKKDYSKALDEYLKTNTNLYSSDYIGEDKKILEDRIEVLWKKREELLWIKKMNSDTYPVEKVMKEYFNGLIPKEKITKIYKELTKDI